jgi:hypothetical protein
LEVRVTSGSMGSRSSSQKGKVALAGGESNCELRGIANRRMRSSALGEGRCGRNRCLLLGFGELHSSFIYQSILFIFGHRF